VKWDIFNLFDGMINIERSYKACDRALDMLKRYKENPKEFEDPEKRAEMDETVNEAIERARKIVNLEGKKNWPGVFREMHKNLANIYIGLGMIEEARAEIEKLKEYGEVGRQDAEEISQRLEGELKAQETAAGA
jgi:tetratricopeptide (TPR) repeat protein